VYCCWVGKSKLGWESWLIFRSVQPWTQQMNTHGPSDGTFHL
jgi:hypothetical protein